MINALDTDCEVIWNKVSLVGNVTFAIVTAIVTT